MEQKRNNSLCYQVISRPLLALSIATIFSDQSECSDGKSDCVTDSHVYPELSPGRADMNTRYMNALNLHA